MNRFTAIACAALIGLSLAGCSDDDDDHDRDQDNGSEMDDQDNEPEKGETVQLSSFVFDVFNDDDPNDEPREINNVNFDVSSDNANEQAFDDVLN